MSTGIVATFWKLPEREAVHVSIDGRKTVCGRPLVGADWGANYEGRDFIRVDLTEEVELCPRCNKGFHPEGIAPTPTHTRGWYNMVCWNGLSHAQQRRLVEHGNLPIDYQPDGWCPNGAEIEITTIHDEAPGPRFYCRLCAIVYLKELK